MFANGERDRGRESDWCRHVKVNIASADQQEERERDVCVCSFLISSVCFFYSGNSSTYFKVLCRSLQKKNNLIVRDV